MSSVIGSPVKHSDEDLLMHGSDMRIGLGIRLETIGTTSKEKPGICSNLTFGEALLVVVEAIRRGHEKRLQEFTTWRKMDGILSSSWRYTGDCGMIAEGSS